MPQGISCRLYMMKWGDARVTLETRPQRGPVLPCEVHRTRTATQLPFLQWTLPSMQLMLCSCHGSQPSPLLLAGMMVQPRLPAPPQKLGDPPSPDTAPVPPVTDATVSARALQSRLQTIHLEVSLHAESCA